MNKFTMIVNKIYSSGKYILPALFLFGLFQIPATSPVSRTSDSQSLLTRTIAPASVEAGEVVGDKERALALTQEFFGKEAELKATHEVIDQKMEFVSSRKAFAASLAVIQKHEQTIRASARKYGVPEDVAIGVGLLENGGSETAKSPAGALGVFQLMPGTARSLGLTVNGKIDERRNPAKNIDAGMRYLALNYYRFGDWGLATWAYHAGEGNVSKAVKLYAKNKHGVTLPGIGNPQPTREYIAKHEITIHKLLSNPAVKTMTKKLNDDSAGYPYKVIATAALFKEANEAREVVSR